MSQQALTVTELTARIKQVLEQGFSQVEVIGEISRLTSPASGHLYFTIKDNHAAISAVVWKTTAVRLKSRPKEGQAFVFIGHISLYEPRGTYQLVIKRIEPVGTGELAAEFEQRKQLFAERGWFDYQRKSQVPKLPQHIGIITSETAAAYEDVKKVLETRPGWLQLTLSPCLVQGSMAPASIARAIRRIQQSETKPDVILLVRGGGSIEDLWCFNDELVVQAIAECSIPIISGIGHEIDTTLADLAADVRGATPSNAAELSCPSKLSLRQHIPLLSTLASLLQRQLQQAKSSLSHLKLRQAQAQNRATDKQNWAFERAMNKIHQSFQSRIQAQKQSLRKVEHKLQQLEPQHILRQDMQRLHAISRQLSACKKTITHSKLEQHTSKRRKLLTSEQQIISLHRKNWQHFHDQLHAMNPSHVLKRGYAMTTTVDNKIISSISTIQLGATVQLHFHDGKAISTVMQINPQESKLS